MNEIYNVLIVDDSKTIRAMVKSMLEEITLHLNDIKPVSMCFDSVEDGQQAVQAVTEQSYDLVITDIYMPIMTGMEFCYKIRNELGYKSLPIIFMTTDNNLETVEKVFQSGATDFITKPINELELRSRIKRIFEQSDTEKQLQVAQQVAMQANQRKSRYLSNVNHELKTPLNGIYGYAQMLQHMEQDLTKLEMINTIVKSSEKMSEMINNLLRLEEIESGNVSINNQSLNIIEIVQGCLSILEWQIKEHDINVNVSIDADLVVVTDKYLLESIVSNLISNAVKYNRPHGKILVTAYYHQDKTRLDIVDTGIGMTSEQLTRIYQPFTRFSKQNEHIDGHGLGMSITKGSIENLGLEMKIDSEVDRGTRVSLFFP